MKQFFRPAARCAIAVMGVTGAQFALAQAWPTKPIRLQVPLASGGGADIVSRVVAVPQADYARLEKLIKQADITPE